MFPGLFLGIWNWGSVDKCLGGGCNSMRESQIYIINIIKPKKLHFVGECRLSIGGRGGGGPYPLKEGVKL